jgi:hypothetical protein
MLALIIVFAFFIAVEEVFAGRFGGLRRRAAGAFALVVFGRELKNAPRTSSSDCWALARNTPDAAADNTIARIISLDISNLPPSLT